MGAEESSMQDDAWTYREGMGRIDVTGYTVEGRDGEVGKVDEATLDPGTSYVVVTTGRWLFGKKVLLPASLVERIDRGEQKVYVARAKDELKGAPEFDEERFREPAYRQQVAAYYAPPASAADEDQPAESDAQP
jgi:hypothetical protein